MSTVDALRETFAAEALEFDELMLNSMATAIDEYLDPPPAGSLALPRSLGYWHQESKREHERELQAIEHYARKLVDHLPCGGESRPLRLAFLMARFYELSGEEELPFQRAWREGRDELDQMAERLEQLATAAAVARKDRGGHLLSRPGNKASPETELVLRLAGQVRIFLDREGYPPDAPERGADERAGTIVELVSAAMPPEQRGELSLEKIRRILRRYPEC